jgi:hypothetical protein
MMHPEATHPEIAEALQRGMLNGFLIAARLLWPYLLFALVLAFISLYVKGRMWRAERDREYRRMAQAFREVNEEKSSRDS